MQCPLCDMGQTRPPPTANGAQALSTKDLQALSTRRVLFPVFDHLVLCISVCHARHIPSHHPLALSRKPAAPTLERVCAHSQRDHGKLLSALSLIHPLQC